MWSGFPGVIADGDEDREMRAWRPFDTAFQLILHDQVATGQRLMDLLGADQAQAGSLTARIPFLTGNPSVIERWYRGLRAASEAKRIPRRDVLRDVGGAVALRAQRGRRFCRVGE